MIVDVDGIMWKWICGRWDMEWIRIMMMGNGSWEGHGNTGQL